MATTNKKTFQQVAKLCADDGFLAPQRTPADARRAALVNTPDSEQEGVTVVAIDVPRGAAVSVVDDGARVPGPVVFYEHCGDSDAETLADLAEEYGVPPRCVRGVETYQDGRWVRL